MLSGSPESETSQVGFQFPSARRGPTSNTPPGLRLSKGARTRCRHHLNFGDARQAVSLRLALMPAIADLVLDKPPGGEPGTAIRAVVIPGPVMEITCGITRPRYARRASPPCPDTASGASCELTPTGNEAVGGHSFGTIALSRYDEGSSAGQWRGGLMLASLLARFDLLAISP